ncbi:polyadenylate-binding protein 8-like isoform X3 [Coffea arabica]|uniref:Polyadenylate-binding protein 8-like isoform X3 n=1 Tax=Coffea arabica TaxID=13443 RepID=A0A6P6SRS6_COFAR|nr:polyadenylate-binding protein 5-like isoform X3 [Coffea arabica]
MTGLRSSGSGLPALYVWTLADTVTGADVHRLFRVCVAIRTEIFCDSIIGRYALVSFAKKEHADLAMNKLASATLHGRPIQMMDCHPCTKMSGLVPDTLFVRNLPDRADIELLEYLFFKYGKIWYINIPRRPDGQSTDYGFVQFDTDGPCRAAIEEMNGYEVLGVRLRVDPYYLDPEKKIFELDSAKPCDGYSQDAADTVCAVRNVLAQQINTGASKGKLLQQIAKVDAAGAFPDCGTGALPLMGNVLIEELSSNVADRLASLPLTDR